MNIYYICTYIDTWYCININMMNQGQARSSSKNRMYNHNHVAHVWQQMDSLIGRKSTATGQHK